MATVVNLSRECLLVNGEATISCCANLAGMIPSFELAELQRAPPLINGDLVLVVMFGVIRATFKHSKS